MTSIAMGAVRAVEPFSYKVMTVVGTRPEIIKLSRVIAALDRYTRHVLVHTGQNYDYELNHIFFEDLEIRRPDYFLSAAGETPVETIGRVLIESDKVLAQEKPDAVLIYGDTNSCLAALAAKRRRIPVFHMEAGNRCFDQRVPEEINRRIIDHISDINMPLTEHARRYLLAEGIRPETIIKTGSTMKEVLQYYAGKIAASRVLERFDLQPGKYFVASAHREENVDDPQHLRGFLESLEALAAHYGYPVIVSLHPRTRHRLQQGRSWNGSEISSDIIWSKPLSFSDYVKLQTSAFCVLSDSGSLTEEAALLGFPAVMIREAHERPEGADAGTTVQCILRPDRVLAAVALATAQRSQCVPAQVIDDYQAPAVSEKVVRIIVSYIDYVRRTVWYEERRGRGWERTSFDDTSSGMTSVSDDQERTAA